MKHSEQINELAAALSKAQGEFTAAERDHIAKVTSKKGEGSSYSYAYADLQAYLEVCRKPLADNGLAFIQDVGVDGQRVTVATRLTHSSGQWLDTSPLVMTSADAMPQSIGSTITYARRYSLSAVLGMASEADDDANAGQGNHASTGQRENNLPACPQCQTNKSVIVGKAEYGGGYVCFGKKGGCGTKWQADGEITGTEPKREPLPVAGRAPSPGSETVKQLAAEHGMKTADQLVIPSEWLSRFTDAQNQITQAASVEELEQLGAGWKELQFPEPVKKALAPLYKSRKALLQTQPQVA